MRSAAPPNSTTTVHVVERMIPGGIETLVLDMVHELPGRHIILSLGGTVDELIAGWPVLERERGHFEALNRSPGLSLKVIPEVRARLLAHKADTVYLHHIGPLLYGGIAGRLARVKTIVHVEHDAWHYDEGRRWPLARSLFALVRPRRVAVSTDIAERMKARDPAAAITVIPPGIDMRRYLPTDKVAARKRLGLSSDLLLIGTTGRLVPVKGQSVLLEAFALLRRNSRRLDGRDVGLVIIGDGPERRALEATARDLGVAHVTHFLGLRADVPDILPALDVFCLPSFNEGLPRSLLEAQAAGVPVVSSDVGGCKHAVCPMTGRLVPPNDPVALAHALAEILSGPDCTPNTRAFVEDRYSLATTLAAFARVVQPENLKCSMPS
ncbi:MAG: glycosyltransferase [Hyphomicrobiaceae bacterium]|nr:glycosyltransferase [Hyphomicrobiaceae bacterium]